MAEKVKCNNKKKFLIVLLVLLAIAVIGYVLYVKFIAHTDDSDSDYIIGEVQSYVVREDNFRCCNIIPKKGSKFKAYPFGISEIITPFRLQEETIIETEGGAQLTQEPAISEGQMVKILYEMPEDEGQRELFPIVEKVIILEK